jgi:hypothetical protein
MAHNGMMTKKIMYNDSVMDEYYEMFDNDSDDRYESEFLYNVSFK